MKKIIEWFFEPCYMIPPPCNLLILVLAGFASMGIVFFVWMVTLCLT